jgi:hypothetical protein
VEVRALSEGLPHVPRLSDSSSSQAVKVARTRRLSPSVRLRFHKRGFHSFHSEVGSEFWTKDRRLRLDPSFQAILFPRTCEPTVPGS